MAPATNIASANYISPSGNLQPEMEISRIQLLISNIRRLCTLIKSPKLAEPLYRTSLYARTGVTPPPSCVTSTTTSLRDPAPIQHQRISSVSSSVISNNQKVIQYLIDMRRDREDCKINPLQLGGARDLPGISQLSSGLF